MTLAILERLERKQHLAIRGAVQRRPASDPAHGDHRTGTRDLVDVHHGVAGDDTQVDRLARPLGEALQDRMRFAHDVEPGHRRARQPDQAEAQPVLLVHGVALQQPALGEGRHQPRRRSFVHVEPPAEL